MKTLISAVVCAAALVSAPAFASKDLATAKGCLACHSQGADMKIGPGYQAVVKKYAGQKDAEAKVAAKEREYRATLAGMRKVIETERREVEEIVL